MRDRFAQRTERSHGPELHTQTLRRSAMTLRLPIATVDQIEQSLGITGHELVGKIAIPSSTLKLGQLREQREKSFFLFRNPETAPSLLDRIYQLYHFPRNEEAGPPLKPGTIEVINEDGLVALEDSRQLGQPETQGAICEPNSQLTIGRGPGIGLHLGQQASRQHVSITTLPEQRVMITDTSVAGTTVTYVS